MARLFFPIHLNGDNRGCEAICRGTIAVLDCEKEQYVGYCSDYSVDHRLGLDQICELIRTRPYPPASKIKAKIMRDVFKHRSYLGANANYYRDYSVFLRRIKPKDICMITGGDMFCYGDNELNYIIDRMAERKSPTVLWGCSFGPENLTSAKRTALGQISAITARESLTYNCFVNDLKLKNVYLVADPAFVLEPQEVVLPEYMEKQVIGINLSNFITEDFSKDNVFFQSVMGLIEYILDKTDLDIALIPHVFWPQQDDRIMCNLVKESASITARVHIMNTEKLNYCQIRYAISKCKFFIGARTHAMISAYSSATPALALGYSIKSKGIAKDLGLDDKLVVDYKTVKSPDDLIERFEYLIDNEETIREHLQSIMPDYIQKAYSAKTVIDNLAR